MTVYLRDVVRETIETRLQCKRKFKIKRFSVKVTSEEGTSSEDLVT